MTLSAHLLNQMNGNISMLPPDKIPLQTPCPPNGYHHNNFATPSSHILNGNDRSQFGSHHGMPPPSPWAMGGMSQGWMGSQPGRFTSWSEEKVATMQVRLQRRLGPEYITQRPGPGGGPKLSYVEGWKVVNLANEVFGFNGWSSSIVSLKTDFLDVNAQDRVNVGITAIIRITLQDGCSHEDVGYGHAENVRGKASALEKAQKEAVTDGVKRALKHFGNVLGNCLYDRDYTKEVAKIRVGPAKFNVDELERRPEFTPKGAPASSRAASAVPQHVSGNAKPAAPISTTAAPPAAVTNRPVQPARQAETPEPPLRSIDDDPEYAFMEDESLLDDFDESVLAGRAGDDVPMLTDKSTNGSRPATTAAPAYTHRQRPEVPAQPQFQPAPGPTSAESSKSLNDVKNEPEFKRRQAMGGVAMANGSSSSGSSARAAAIMAGLNSGPIRAESPRIPSGGIDAVAARATTNMRTHGQNLEIENAERIDTPGKYAAFSSARGVKRDGSQSPTKPDRSRVGGFRAALADLPVPEGGPDWQSKRSRIM